MRYFFDVHDGHRFTSDETGADYVIREELKQAAMRLLPDIAAHAANLSDGQVFSVRIRDECGNHIFFATLSLNVTCMDNGEFGPARPN